MTVIIQMLAKLVGLAFAFFLTSAFLIWLDPWLSQQSPWQLMGLNLLPVWGVMLILLGLFARPSPAILLTMGFLSGIFYLNSIKLVELNQPLLFTDLLLIGQVIHHIDFLADYVDVQLLTGLSIAGSIGVAMLCISEPAWLNKSARWLSALLGVMLLSVIATSPFESVYSQDNGPNRPWAPKAQIEAQGWLASAMASIHTDWVSLPKADTDSIAALKTKWAKLRRTEFVPDRWGRERPDVVVILSESFFEPRYLKGAELCVLLPNWCELLNQGIHGEMTVPTFGGNTTRTEYEVLTGIPYATLPEGIYPYTSVVLKPSASIAWWAKTLGYQTTAIHPHDRYFWQRHRALPLLGFDAFIGEQEFGPHRREGFWISDHDLSNKIIETLDQDPNTPQWIFAISMENHGPWHGKRPNMDAQRKDALPRLAGLDARGDHAYRNYLYHQQNAVTELDRLWKTVQQRPRPTVVLFFGDHLPGLHETFKQAGFGNDWTPTTHPVPFLLLTHPQPTSTEWLPKKSYQLGVWLMAHLNLPLPIDYEILIDQWRFGNEAESNDSTELYPYLIALDPEAWHEEHCGLYEVC